MSTSRVQRWRHRCGRTTDASRCRRIAQVLLKKSSTCGHQASLLWSMSSIFFIIELSHSPTCSGRVVGRCVVRLWRRRILEPSVAQVSTAGAPRDRDVNSVHHPAPENKSQRTWNLGKQTLNRYWVNTRNTSYSPVPVFEASLVLPPSNARPELVIDATPVHPVVRIASHEALAVADVASPTALRVPADYVSAGGRGAVKTFQRSR